MPIDEKNAPLTAEKAIRNRFRNLYETLNLWEFLYLEPEADAIAKTNYYTNQEQVLACEAIETLGLRRVSPSVITDLFYAGHLRDLLP